MLRFGSSWSSPAACTVIRTLTTSRWNNRARKHEYFQGEIYAMAGGSEEHSALAAEVLRLLGNALGDRPWRTHTSDLRIYVEATGMATFPDGSVVYGKL